MLLSVSQPAKKYITVMTRVADVDYQGCDWTGLYKSSIVVCP